MRVLIQVGKATSLNEVGRQVAQVGEKLGYVIVLNRYMPQFSSYTPLFKAVIFIYPFLPAWCMSWFYHFYKALRELDGNAVFYTTVEGVPKFQIIPDWVRKSLSFIAVSNYVKRCLEKVEVKVLDVVHHGYPEFELKEALEKAQSLRKVIEQNFSNKVVFGYVGDLNFRKGLNKLFTAVKMLASKRRDFHVLVISRREILQYINDIPCVSFVSEFGSRNHVEIMAFYKAVDFLLFPSLAEGFGLPLLEANAVGTPVILNKLPPFKEYADMRANLVFTPTHVNIYDNEDGVLYELYEYDVKDLVTTMEEAIEMKKSRKSEYEDRCIKVREKVKNLTSEKQYEKLFKYFKFE